METRDREIICHTSLRGLAALSVLLYHARLFTGETGYYLADNLFRHAYLFVDLFFILSGYILYARYGLNLSGDRLRGRDIRSFLTKRLARVYPNYLAWLLISILVVQVIRLKDGQPLQLSGDAGVSLLMHLLLVQSLLGAPIIWNLPLWSIAVEGVAYLVFAPLSWLRRRGGVLFDLGAAAAAFAILLGLEARGSLDVVEGAPSLLRCLAGFSLGMTLAGRRSVDLALFRRPALLGLAQASAFMAAFTAVNFGREVPAVLAFAALVFVTGVNRGPLFGLLRLAPAHFLGLISFSLYLAHIPVMNLAAASIGRIETLTGIPVLSDWILFSAVTAAGSILAGWLSFVLLEKPSQRWLTHRLVGRS